MKHRKPTSRLMNETPSHINRRLKNMKIPTYNADVDQMILLAEEKIAPILQMLTNNPKGVAHYIHVNDCNRLEEFWIMTRDILVALENVGFLVNINLASINLRKYKESANSKGMIYVDTTLLLNIIELHNVLQTIKEELEAFYKSIGIHSFVQTESGLLSVTSAESSNPNKIVFKLNKFPTRASSRFGLLSNDFFVMPAISSTDGSEPLSASKSEILEGSFIDDALDVRKVQSVSSVEEQLGYHVSDAYGANKILVRCIGDLQNVSNYLGRPMKDAFTIYSLLETGSVGPGAPGSVTDDVDGGAATQRASTHRTAPTSHGADNIDSKGNCCCKECFADSDGVRPECEDDQVIICIKGCDEDEGDVQIVIRQCPDCKKDKPQDKPEGTPKTPTRDRITHTESKRSVRSGTSRKSVSIEPSPYQSQSRPYAAKTRSTESNGSSDLRLRPREIESSILHNKDSRGDIICSDEEDEQVQTTANMLDCSRINMFETTNLCLKTETGQELVISLTVTPKNLAPGKLSIRDIFSEDLEQRSSGSGKARPKTKRTSYFVSDRYIPLGRTKVCSSLDFDVGTADSKLRGKGIKHKDNKIVVQLEDLGPDNLLRACRPAKCCRKSILNERMKKCLPYAPSIRSLPLDDEDMKVINESLEMSLQKVKNSINIKRDFYANQAYVHTVMYFTVEEDMPNQEIMKKVFIRKKLGYYINLVKDLPMQATTIYNVMYFGVDDKIDKVVKNTHPRIPNNNPNEEAETSNNRVINVNIAEVQSTPISYIKSYDERPALMSHQNFFFERRSSFLKTLHKRESFKNPESEPKVSEKKPFVSKIPVYQGKKKDELAGKVPGQKDSFESFPHLQNILEAMSEDFGFSSSSLKAGDTAASTKYTQNKITKADDRLDLNKDGIRGNVSKIAQKQPNLFSESFLDFLNKIPKQNRHAIDLNKTLQSSPCPPSTGDSLKDKHILSKCSLSSSNGGRNKRKKKEFYLAKSKSEVSMSSSKRLSKNQKVKPLDKRVKPHRAIKADEVVSACTNRSKASSISQDEENLSRIMLNYFSKVLYKMVMQKVLEDKDKSRKVLSVGVGTDRTSLQEIYRRTVHQFSRNKNTKHSHHELKAKQSQLCIAIPFLTNQNSDSVCVFNNLALQTSIIFGDTKNCQTSETLLTYLVQTESFLKAYHQTSQAQIDLLLNGFTSEESLSSTFTGVGIMSPYLSDFTTESEDSDTLDQSLFKLKDTLEKYENMKQQIAQKNKAVNPIDYFVYQMCACNGKLNLKKKPSMMQKLFGKTKGLFSSTEKDLCRKYENQRRFMNMSSQDRAESCYSCGCFISKGGDAKPPVNIGNLLCMCPDEDKSKKPPSITPYSCKQTKATAKKLTSKLQSASTSSLKVIQNCFKRSMEEIANKGAKVQKSLAKMKSTKTTQKDSGHITICYNPSMQPVVCEKKSAATGTTKDNATQKCACGKCDSLLEDGTCCCSHCLGCLDKSFNAKLDNENEGKGTNGGTQTSSEPSKINESVETKQEGNKEASGQTSKLSNHSVIMQASTNNQPVQSASTNKELERTNLSGMATNNDTTIALKDKSLQKVDATVGDNTKNRVSIVANETVNSSNNQQTKIAQDDSSVGTVPPGSDRETGTSSTFFDKNQTSQRPNDESSNNTKPVREKSVVEPTNEDMETTFGAPLATSTPANSREDMTHENQGTDDSENTLVPENSETNHPGGSNANNNTTTYLLLAPTPQMFQSLNFGSGNPFEPFTLGFPQSNVFQINQPSDVFRR